MVNTAIALGLIIIVLIGTELGYTFYMKRELQKAADLAALAGAQALQQSLPNDCGNATTAAVTNAKINLPGGISFADPVVGCGRWDPQATPISPHFGPPGVGELFNAVHVTIDSPKLLLLHGLPGNEARTISVEATAARIAPRAALTIRSRLLSVSTSQSPLLNAVFGGLLKGSVNLTAVGWDGLVKTNVNLLSFLDQLAIKLNVGVGQYDQLLSTEASLGTVLQAAIDVLQRNGSTAQATVDAISGLLSLQGSIPPGTRIKLGDLLKIQTGTTAAGLDLNLQAFQLIQAMVQVASKNSGIDAEIPLSIPGLATISVKFKVTEPPQISAIGNPELAKLDSDGVNGIFVRTAQIRTLITADIPGLSIITDLLNAVTNLLTPVTSLLNSVLSLNLQSILENILCLNCTKTKVVLVPDNPVRISIGLSVAAGKAKVTDFSCAAPSSSSLKVETQTAITNIQIGQVADKDKAAFFSSSASPTIQPIPIMDVQTSQCAVVLGVSVCGDWINYSRTGLKADTSVGATSGELNYVNPPLLEQEPAYQSISAKNIVDSLTDTLGGLQLQTYKYQSSAVNHFGNLIGTATQLVTGVLTLVKNLIHTLLSPLLDPLINFLLTYLGINLAQSDVGARLSCANGAELVY